MIAVQFARIIANFSLLLDISDDNTLDLDTVVQMMETLAADLELLDRAFLRELVDAFQVIAPEYEGEAQQLVRDIADGYGLEEVIAADDPVRLAEPAAMRDARDNHQNEDSQAMNVLQIARIIADCLLFLDLTDDDKLDPDAAAHMMEVLGANLVAMDKAFLRELVDAFQVIAPEYPGKSPSLVRDIAYDYYLEEAIAADDPARLAELQALRDVRGD